VIVYFFRMRLWSTFLFSWFFKWLLLSRNSVITSFWVFITSSCFLIVLVISLNCFFTRSTTLNSFSYYMSDLHWFSFSRFNLKFSLFIDSISILN
jgi:hypothetical protein